MNIALHLLTPPSTLRPARVELVIDYLSHRFRNICVKETAARAAKRA
jgi:hypothetical protein